MSTQKLEVGTKSFMANGKKYIVSETISIARFKQYEKLVPRLTFGLDFNQLFANLKTAFEALNKQQFANSAIILHNLMNGISKVEDDNRVNPALLMASLMINREDEDVSVYNENIALDKINDWQVEGLDMMGFFQFSLSCINGFKETLTKYTQEQANILSSEMKMQS